MRAEDHPHAARERGVEGRAVLEEEGLPGADAQLVGAGLEEGLGLADGAGGGAGCQADDANELVDHVAQQVGDDDGRDTEASHEQPEYRHRVVGGYDVPGFPLAGEPGQEDRTSGDEKGHDELQEAEARGRDFEGLQGDEH